MNKNQNGNVLIYILLAVALLAALTYAVSGDGRGNQASRMDVARVDLMTGQLIDHVTEVERAFFQMNQWGTDVADFRFDLPGSTDYASNTTHQIYHPAGGGIKVFDPDADFFDGNGTTGFAFQTDANVEWSISASDDILFSFVNLSDGICAEVNDRLRGSTTIPSGTMTTANVFVENGTNADFLISECAACENVKAMCINDGTTNIYYTLLSSQ